MQDNSPSEPSVRCDYSKVLCRFTDWLYTLLQPQSAAIFIRHETVINSVDFQKNDHRKGALKNRAGGRDALAKQFRGSVDTH